MAIGPVLQRYLSPYGSINRKAYWLHCALPILALNIVAFSLMTDENALAVVLFSAASNLPLMLGAAKRARDMRATPWLALAMLAPYAGTAAAVALGVARRMPVAARCTAAPTE